MKTQEIIERLKEECPLLNGRVSGSADYDLAIESNRFSTPCAYVVELKETSEMSQSISDFTQYVTAQIGVMIIVSNKKDTTGHAAHEQLQDVRLEVKNALCNWQHSECDTPFFHLAGQSSGSYDLNRFWADVFVTHFFYEN